MDQQVLLSPANKQSCEKTLRKHRPLPTLKNSPTTCYTQAHHCHHLILNSFTLQHAIRILNWLYPKNVMQSFNQPAHSWIVLMGRQINRYTEQKLTASPLLPASPGAPTGPGGPWSPWGPAKPSGPESPLSPWKSIICQSIATCKARYRSLF